MGAQPDATMEGMAMTTVKEIDCTDTPIIWEKREVAKIVSGKKGRENDD